jgi:predicted metal-binding membrane protein
MRLGAAVEGVLRRDGWVVLSILAAVIVASWAYILAGAGMGMPDVEATGTGRLAEPMAGMAMMPTAWSPGHAVVMFLMWWIMMVAMMLPGATPMILLFAAINRRQRRDGKPYVPTTLFTASYLAAWAGFSLAATALHWYLSSAGLIAPDMVVTSRLLGAGLLLAAGLYQLTPIKQACLKHCRLPAAYLASHWRPGPRGAVVMGLQHGAYCLGCCWFLMLLLFFGGVMNVLWIAGLTLLVLLEKVAPHGRFLARVSGAVLIGAAVLVLAG